VIRLTATGGMALAGVAVLAFAGTVVEAATGNSYAAYLGGQNIVPTT
jgi:hypothetical protein